VKSARLNPMNVALARLVDLSARRRCWRRRARAALTGRACDCRKSGTVLARPAPSTDGPASMALRSDVVEAAGVRSSEPVQSAAELGQSAVHCCGGWQKLRKKVNLHGCGCALSALKLALAWERIAELSSSDLCCASRDTTPAETCPMHGSCADQILLII